MFPYQLILNWAKIKALSYPISNREITDPFEVISVVNGHKTIVEEANEIYILVDGHYIEFVNEFKLLGVTIDKKITFESHIYNIISKVNSKTFTISRNIQMFPSKIHDTRQSLYILITW